MSRRLLERITSLQNSKVKLVQRLRGKRGRQSESRFVVETPRDLQRALAQDYPLDFLLLCPALLAPSAASLAQAQAAFEISPQLIKRLSYRDNASGLIAVMKTKPVQRLQELRMTQVDSAILMVDPRKPGNIGALLRTGNAAGIDAMVLVDCALDLYNPNIIRNSVGACFGGNIFQLSSAEAIGYFRERDFQLIAADGGGERSLYELDLRQKTAIALGAEDTGLDARWLDSCDRRARIPMAGDLSDSLNLSVSGALFMYEMMRQRQSR